MYALLGVAPDADAMTIRRGYRERVRALRLDLDEDPESNDLLVELTHAYEVLAHPTSRSLYDRTSSRDEPARTTGRELVPAGGRDLATWVLGVAEPESRAAVAVAVAPSQDRLVRYIATAGFVIALVFLASLLLHS